MEGEGAVRLLTGAWSRKNTQKKGQPQKNMRKKVELLECIMMD